jgi:hypothetical protein
MSVVWKAVVEKLDPVHFGLIVVDPFAEVFHFTWIL